MSRPLRLQYEDASYHVMSRATRREKLFNHPTDKDHFISIMEKAFQRYGIICYAYCLLDNHYHLFIRTLFPNLSKAMHTIHCSYGTWIRNKYKLPGAIFQGRYKSIIVDSDSYAIQLATYIHLNPLTRILHERILKFSASP